MNTVFCEVITYLSAEKKVQLLRDGVPFHCHIVFFDKGKRFPCHFKRLTRQTEHGEELYIDPCLLHQANGL